MSMKLYYDAKISNNGKCKNGCDAIYYLRGLNSADSVKLTKEQMCNALVSGQIVIFNETLKKKDSLNEACPYCGKKVSQYYLCHRTLDTKANLYGKLKSALNKLIAVQGKTGKYHIIKDAKLYDDNTTHNGYKVILKDKICIGCPSQEDNKKYGRNNDVYCKEHAWVPELNISISSTCTDPNKDVVDDLSRFMLKELARGENQHAIEAFGDPDTAIANSILSYDFNVEVDLRISAVSPDGKKECSGVGGAITIYLNDKQLESDKFISSLKYFMDRFLNRMYATLNVNNYDQSDVKKYISKIKSTGGTLGIDNQYDYVCIGKIIHDNETFYMLRGRKGDTRVDKKILKETLRSGKVKISNLKLTSDNRLIEVGGNKIPTQTL